MLTRREQIAARFECGESVTAIAADLGVAHQTVSTTLKSMGYPVRRGGRTVGQSSAPDLDPEAIDIENDRIHALRNLGLSLKQIGDVCGMDQSTVHRRLKRSTPPDPAALMADRHDTGPAPPDDQEDDTDRWADLSEAAFYWEQHARHYKQRCEQFTPDWKRK